VRLRDCSEDRVSEVSYKADVIAFIDCMKSSIIIVVTGNRGYRGSESLNLEEFLTAG